MTRRSIILYALLIALISCIGLISVLHINTVTALNNRYKALMERYESDQQFIDKLQLENVSLSESYTAEQKYQLEYYLIKEHSTTNRNLITSYINGFQLSPFSSNWSCGLDVGSDLVSCSKKTCERFEGMMAQNSASTCKEIATNDPVPRSKFSSFNIKLSTTFGAKYDQDFNQLEREAESHTTPKGQTYYISLDENKNEIITYFSRTSIEKPSPYGENSTKHGKYVIHYLPYHENGLITKEDEAKMKVFTESVIDHTGVVTNESDQVPMI